MSDAAVERESEERPVRRLEAIDTVRLAIRPTALEAMRDFYGRLLGLRPVDAGADELCYRVGNLELRIRSEETAGPPPPRRRLILEVGRLLEVRARLRAEGVEYEVTHEVGFGRPRVLVRDPAGHWLQLKQVWLF
jgi:catechol 2,3-dioxygenase-like lactoylglutathione lyase family enzyme